MLPVLFDAVVRFVEFEDELARDAKLRRLCEFAEVDDGKADV